MKHLGLVFFSRLTSLAYTQLLSQPALHEPIQASYVLKIKNLDFPIISY